MRFVAVAADDAGRVHFALQERAVNVDLIQNLAVGKIQPALDQRQAVEVVVPFTRVVFVHLAATRVTARTHFQLRLGPLAIEPDQRGWAR